MPRTRILKFSFQVRLCIGFWQLNEPDPNTGKPIWLWDSPYGHHVDLP